MPYKTFNNWLFDGKKDSPIPRPQLDENGKVAIDILKYNSPITHTYLISLFLKHGPLNQYLNEYFNNINLRYLSKEEIFKFIKKCIFDFKINKRDMMFYKHGAKKMLYEKLREKISLLKNDDLLLLCNIIEKSENKDAIFDSLGIEQQKKIKVEKIKKTKTIKTKKISLDELMNKHFSIIDI